MACGVASAQAPAGPPPGTSDAPTAATPTAGEDASRRARELFREGLSRFQAEDYRAAITAFEQAAELVPSADLWFNIARAHEELDEYEQAADAYARYLRDRVDPPDRARVEERIATLREQAEAARLAARRAPTTGTLRVESDVRGAEVAIDGRAVGTTPIPLPLTLAAGRQELAVDRSGYVPFRATVGIEPGVSTAARVSLEPSTEYRAVRERRVFTWILAGLGGAAAACAAGLGGYAVHLHRDGDDAAAGRYAMYSDYALGATMGLAVTTAIVAFVEGRSLRTERVSAR